MNVCPIDSKLISITCTEWKEHDTILKKRSSHAFPALCSKSQSPICGRVHFSQAICISGYRLPSKFVLIMRSTYNASCKNHVFSNSHIPGTCVTLITTIIVYSNFGRTLGHKKCLNSRFRKGQILKHFIFLTENDYYYRVQSTRL